MSNLKHKILMVIQYMELGGIERALLGYFEHIDFDQYEVDVFIHRHTGELMTYIPKTVTVLPEQTAYALLTQPMIKCFKLGYWAIGFARLRAKFQAFKFKLTNKGQENDSIFQYVAQACNPYLPMMSEKMYDVAISFITPHVFVLDKCNAHKKYAWVHTDYSKVSIDVQSEFATWAAYDKIIAVSALAKKAFDQRFKGLETKTMVIENPLPVQLIQTQSQGIVPPLSQGINFLTIGRFCYAKAQEQAVAIAYQLIQKGWDLHWYFIGYGDEHAFWQAVEQFQLHDRIHHLGKLSNPYPYIKACDYYVQASRYEGKAVTVQEAQFLKKTVIISHYATAESQVQEGIDGYIVPQDIPLAVESIHHLLMQHKQISFSNTQAYAWADHTTFNQLLLV